MPNCCNTGFNWLQFASIVSGAFVAVFSGRIAAWIFRPRLHFVFDEQRCVKRTPTQASNLYTSMPEESEGTYVRIELRVRGSHTAKGCHCYLVGVERQRGAHFEPTEFADSLQLTWSSRPPDQALSGIDIPPGLSQFVDVLATDRSRPYSFIMQISPTPFYLSKLFDVTPKCLRFTIMATADGVSPVFTILVLDWRGSWEDFSIRQG